MKKNKVFFVVVAIVLVAGFIYWVFSPSIEVEEFNQTLSAIKDKIDFNLVPMAKRDVIYKNKIFSVGYKVNGEEFLKEFPGSYIQISGSLEDSSSKIFTNHKAEEVIVFIKK